jgi:hypothetical protein
LSTQFADEVCKSINFIGKTTQPTFLKGLPAPLRGKSLKGAGVEVAVNTKLTKLTNSTLYPLICEEHGLKFIKLINKQFDLSPTPYPASPTGVGG